MSLLIVVFTTLSALFKSSRRPNHRIDKLKRSAIRSPKSSAMSKIIAKGDDAAYITTFGVDCTAFAYLHQRFGSLYRRYFLRRCSYSLEVLTNPCHLLTRSLSSRQCLALVLAWYRTKGEQRSLSLLCGCVPSVTSHYIRFGHLLLDLVLADEPMARVQFPTHHEIEAYSFAISVRYPRLYGAFAFVDGLELPVQQHTDQILQASNYDLYTQAHHVANILLFAPDGTIIFAIVNGPGVWHDSHLACTGNLYDILDEKVPKGYYVLADSAFPATPSSQHIRRQSKANEAHPLTLAGKLLEKDYGSARQSAEWGNRGFSAAYPRLKSGLPAEPGAYRALILETAVRLYNFRTRFVGLSSIQSVWWQYLASEPFK